VNTLYIYIYKLSSIYIYIIRVAYIIYINSLYIYKLSSLSNIYKPSSLFLVLPIILPSNFLT